MLPLTRARASTPPPPNSTTEHPHRRRLQSPHVKTPPGACVMWPLIFRFIKWFVLWANLLRAYACTPVHTMIRFTAHLQAPATALIRPPAPPPLQATISSRFATTRARPQRPRSAHSIKSHVASSYASNRSPATAASTSWFNHLDRPQALTSMPQHWQIQAAAALKQLRQPASPCDTRSRSLAKKQLEQYMHRVSHVTCNPSHVTCHKQETRYNEHRSKCEGGGACAGQ